MTDTSDSIADSFAARTSRTSPEAIAERTFSQVKRGYAESEVRAYLRMVSNDFASVVSRERELAARVHELEEQQRRPVLPPSDQDLIAALGEETARVLGQARESAVELKSKAEEHARRVVREAQETARELRTTTQQAVETKTREAEDAARTRAKEIVGEARALRERVITDLEARRAELEAQIADLRTGRAKLVETYELVERALAHAARVIAEEPSRAPEVPAAGDAATTEPAPTPAPPTARGPAAEGAEEPPAPTAVEAEKPPAPSEAPGAAASAPDVGALFDKLRSEQAETGAPEPSAAGDAAPPDVEAPEVEAPDPDGEDAAGDAAGPNGDGSMGAAEDPAKVARDAALADVGDELLRRGKRALQDEQNDLLDGLRRQRGKIDTAKVLPTFDEQAARWTQVLQPALDNAYSSGAASVESGRALDAAPPELVTELSTSVVTPLRERIGSSLDQIDARTPADAEIAVAQSLGARYREWRGEQLEGVLGDALAAAWSRGVFDAAPDGARLRWVPAVEGKCPDCDDNALEPTVKGSDFPTGQAHPPAHPGCRCLLVVVEG